MGGDKEGFKSRPGLEIGGLALPDFTVVEKQPCLENELESNAYDLLRIVGRVVGCRILDDSFYLIDECSNGVIGVVGDAYLCIVELKVGWQNICIDGVHVVDKLACGRSAISDVTVAKVPSV